MSILKVLNVGQGDSMIITPDSGCRHADKKLFVDLGPGQKDISQYISDTDIIHIFITHHDEDHIGGMKFLVQKMEQVEDITVPFYQNEVTLIAKSILSLKGIGDARDCGEFIRLLEDILANQAFLKSIIERSRKGPHLAFAYEGLSICDHIEVLNPPITIEKCDWLNSVSKVDLFPLFEELFEVQFAQSIRAFLLENVWSNNVDATGISDLMLPGYSEAVQFEQAIEARRAFVLNYFLHNVQRFRAFNANPSRANMRKIYYSFIRTAHDACIVLKLNYGSKTFLLTGDASKEVFSRLINEGVDISADYLKIPHHGSKKNINRTILASIKPAAAIISHNNRRFGNARDSHPNVEVLNLLKQQGIAIMLTNDVEKNHIVIMEKSDHLGDAFVEIL